MVEAKRGYLYRFNTGRFETDAYAVVVSNDNRRTAKRVSVLILSQYCSGYDAIEIPHDEFECPMYVHPSLVTYTEREYLSGGYRLPDQVMEHIDKGIAANLGIYTESDYQAQFYKEQYDELIQKLMGSHRKIEA